MHMSSLNAVIVGTELIEVSSARYSIEGSAHVWSREPARNESIMKASRTELRAEYRVVWNLLNMLHAAGWVISSVNDGEENVQIKGDLVKALDAVFAVDEAWINVRGSNGKRAGSIFIVLGNSAEEVISDWSWVQDAGGNEFDAFVQAFKAEQFV
jgi:hypothetical protein